MSDLPGFDHLFSETISENPRKQEPKRKRGRPPKYTSPSDRAALENRSAENLGKLFQKKIQRGQKLTARQQQNHILAERAQNIILNSKIGKLIPPDRWLQSTVLAQLGRIKNEELLIKTATLIVCHGWRGEKARAEIRKIRFGDASPDIRILERKIRKAIREYRSLFPHQSDEDFKTDFQTITISEMRKLALEISESKKSPAV